LATFAVYSSTSPARKGSPVPAIGSLLSFAPEPGELLVAGAGGSAVPGSLIGSEASVELDISAGPSLRSFK
jgi:hypothetical protein